MLQNHKQLACIRVSRELLSGSRGDVSDTSSEDMQKKLKLSCRSSLECASCIWSASFQELISSPLSPHPSLPLRVFSALSQIRLIWDTESSSGFMLWGILGVSISFTDVWALAVFSTWQRHHCSLSYQNMHGCPTQSSRWINGVLMHKLTGAYPWNI